MTRWVAKLALPLILLVTTGVLAYVGFRADAAKERDRAQSSSAQATRAVESLTRGLGDHVHDVAGLFNASDSVSSREFKIYAEPVLATSGASAYGFASVVKHRDRRAFERKHGYTIKVLGPDGKPRTAPRRAQYVVSEYSVRSTRDKRVPGLDLSSDGPRRRALVAAAASGLPTATPPVKLGGNGRLGLAIYMPVYRVALASATSGSTTPLLGYAVGSYRFTDLSDALKAALPGVGGLTLSYRGEQAVAFGNPEGESVHRTVQAAGRTFDLTTATPPGGRIGLGWAFLIAGLLMTLVLTLITYLILRASHRGRELAEARGREQELMLGTQERKSAVAEERFSQIFETATIGMALLGPGGQYTKVNEAFCRLVARDESDLIGITPEDITHPDDVRAAKGSIAGMFGGTQTEFEDDKRYIDGNGKIVWVALRAKALHDEGGKTEMVLIQVLDISERRLLQDRLAHMADHDALTGLPNRRSFDKALGQHLSLVRRYGPEGALLLIDLDNFKGVNDLHGHNEGDVMLREVADAIRAGIRDTDIPARVGGDEFGVLLPKGSTEDVEVVAARLVKAISALGDKHSHEGVDNLTCSIGAALLQPETHTVERITEEADIAMYEAKGAGGNQFSISAPSAA